MRTKLTTAILLSALATAPAAAQSTTADTRGVVERALPLIQKSLSGYTRQRGCFSCHHQGMGVLALATARDRGFAIDAKVLEEQVRFTENSLRGGRDNYRRGKPQGGAVDTAGSALMALDVGGWKPDETTSAVTEFLLLWKPDLDHWGTGSNRPPSEKSPFTTTFVALRGLAVYSTPEQKERAAARREAALKWLQSAPAKDTEDRTFRLWALKYAGADTAGLEAAAKELLDTQRDDGGWSQTPDMISDAYATGSALTALHVAGGLGTADAAYQRGVRFLLQSQKEDGSWYVASRSRPFQPYFESGFPYGKDQFISMSAACWATTALALSLPAK